MNIIQGIPSNSRKGNIRSQAVQKCLRQIYPELTVLSYFKFDYRRIFDSQMKASIPQELVKQVPHPQTESISLVSGRRDLWLSLMQACVSQMHSHIHTHHPPGSSRLLQAIFPSTQHTFQSCMLTSGASSYLTFLSHCNPCTQLLLASLSHRFSSLLLLSQIGLATSNVFLFLSAQTFLGASR